MNLFVFYELYLILILRKKEIKVLIVFSMVFIRLFSNLSDFFWLFGIVENSDLLINQ